MYQLELYLTWHVSRRHPGHMPRPHADEASRSEPTSQRHACHANEPRAAEVAREGYALKASKCASGIKACFETSAECPAICAPPKPNIHQSKRDECGERTRDECDTSAGRGGGRSRESSGELALRQRESSLGHGRASATSIILDV